MLTAVSFVITKFWLNSERLTNISLMKPTDRHLYRRLKNLTDPQHINT